MKPKEHCASLFHAVKQKVDNDKRNSTKSWLDRTEAIAALLSAGREVWTAYDPELKTKKAVCASLGLKYTATLNDIHYLYRYGKAIKDNDISVTVNAMRALSKLTQDKDRDEELLLIAAEYGTGEVKKRVDEIIGKTPELECNHPEIETWTKCKKCHKWVEK